MDSVKQKLFYFNHIKVRSQRKSH